MMMGEMGTSHMSFLLLLLTLLVSDRLDVALCYML